MLARKKHDSHTTILETYTTYWMTWSYQVIIFVVTLGIRIYAIHWGKVLFVCSELIEKLVRATGFKFGRGIGNTVSRNKF